MKKTSITFIIPDLQNGGAERVLVTLANALIKDYNVTIIVFFKCIPFYSLNPKVNVEFCTKSFKNTNSKWSSFLNNLKLLKGIYTFSKKHRSDIIIGFMTTANFYSVIVSKLLNVPCIISERVHPKYSGINEFGFRLRKWIYPYTSLLVVQTKGIKDYFKVFMNDDSIKIINNPLSPELIKQKDENSIKEKIILNVGRLDDQKNQDLLIKAFANIDNANWKLIIIGEGKNRTNYKNLIESLKLENKVLLLGKISNVSDYYNKASVFAFTSRFEGFPNALIEAMFFGIPSISTDCPSGPSELIINNQNGFLIPVEDQKMLESRLDQLINDESLRHKFSINSVESTTIFEQDKIVEQWKNLIESLTN